MDRSINWTIVEEPSSVAQSHCGTVNILCLNSEYMLRIAVFDGVAVNTKRIHCYTVGPRYSTHTYTDTHTRSAVSTVSPTKPLSRIKQYGRGNVKKSSIHLESVHKHIPKIVHTYCERQPRDLWHTEVKKKKIRFYRCRQLISRFPSNSIPRSI